jgi:hypothetical protein
MDNSRNVDSTTNTGRNPTLSEDRTAKGTEKEKRRKIQNMKIRRGRNRQNKVGQDSK